MSHVPVPIIKKKAVTHRSGRRFRERKYTALFQETVRQFLENKVIIHNTTEFITPEGDVINLPIEIQFRPNKPLNRMYVQPPISQKHVPTNMTALDEFLEKRKSLC